MPTHLPHTSRRQPTFTDFDKRYLIDLGDRVASLEKKVKNLEETNERVRKNLREVMEEGPE